ncbi:MAG: hypothetical protein B7C55_04035 [Actinomycetales bacterium mxb001]|nr:MAG: hypothetical protein B7C55_04035 [Actinomycetales bacterium mxb001]
MEVLEQGRPDESAVSSRRPLLIAISAVVEAIIIAVTGIAGYRWWSEQQSRPEALEVLSVQVLAQTGVAIADGGSGWPGGLGTPVGALAPAAQVRVSVAGDPQRSTQLAAIPPGPGVHVSPFAPILVPAAQTGAIDLTVSPSDCLMAEATPKELLVTAEGEVVSLSTAAADSLASLMVDLCAEGGSAPSLALSSALIDTFFRDRTLVFTVDVQSDADRVVLTPLDGTAVRGLGAQDLAGSGQTQSVRLRWLVSPGEMTPNTSLTGRVQAYTVVNGIAYPWIVVMPAPRDLEVRTSMGLTPLRNDGVDLAEVAPRPN